MVELVKKILHEIETNELSADVFCGLNETTQIFHLQKGKYRWKKILSSIDMAHIYNSNT